MEQKKEVKAEKRQEEQTLDNRCPSCGASISFNPSLGKWKCEYCGNSFSLEELSKNSTPNKTKSKNEDSYNDYISYKCESCGAEIVADSETAATFCVYCGNTAILKSKLSGKFSPNRVIPFKTERQLAIDSFKNISKGRPLVPKKFNNLENIEKIKGVYIPFWLYTVNVSGSLKIKGKKVRSWTVGDTHYTETKIYDVVRGGTMDFKNIPIDGSTRFDNAIMNSIEPFDYKDLVPYNHAYLSGFFAERYDTDGPELLDEVGKRALNSAKEELMKDVTEYTSTTITTDTLAAKEVEREYVLLPVWMVNVRYKDKLYTFAMNGQTGEFIGNIPVDKAKAIIYSIITFIISFLIFVLITYFIHK